jgi:hypothetical protein
MESWIQMNSWSGYEQWNGSFDYKQTTEDNRVKIVGLKNESVQGRRKSRLGQR